MRAGASAQGRSSDERRRPITVLLVDDEELIRRLLSEVLPQAGIEVVGEAGRGERAIELAVDLRPDVVLMDLQMPGISGIEAIERLASLAPASRVLVLTGHEGDGVVRAIVAGARGYILKGAANQEMVDAVRATAAGEAVIAPAIAGRLLERIRERDIPVTASDEFAGAAIRAALTERELDIFTRLASGAANQEIGRDLSLSPNTVKNHVASILFKLQLDNRIQAAVHAVRSGIS